MATSVYVTIDVEASMGGADGRNPLRVVPAERRVFCRIDGRDHGIGWQCDELRQRGLRASFFCEVLSTSVLGADDTRSFVDFLLQQQQDVQLHAHPTFWFHAERLAAISRGDQMDPGPPTDDLSSLDESRQQYLLERACEFFVRFTSRRPAAFRASGFRADRRTLSVLSKLGIALDSSFNPTYQGCGSFDGERMKINVPQEISNVWELPITVAIENLPVPGRTTRLKPLIVNALTTQEMIRILEHCERNGLEHVVAVFHSFGGVKAKDFQYSAMRPDRIVRKRFTGLLDFLSRNRDRFTVSTFGDLANRTDSLRPAAEVPLPELGYLRPFGRRLVQLLNEPYWV